MVIGDWKYKVKADSNWIGHFNGLTMMTTNKKQLEYVSSNIFHKQGINNENNFSLQQNV